MYDCKPTRREFNKPCNGRYLGVSMHKNLFPLSGGDIGGISLAAAALFVAAGGGIG
jgi:hypothetical protein